MAYVPIAKIEKFTGEEDNAQVWLNDEFKTAFLEYFSNNNSINRLANTFTTIKQGKTEAVTTYLGCFHSTLNFKPRVCLMHPQTFQIAITNARNFELAEFEASHVQAINLVMNRSSELDSKLKQFSDLINQKLEEYLADNCAIYQPLQQPNNSKNMNHFQNQLCLSSSPNHIISTNLPTNDAIANVSTTHISTSSLSTAATNNISTTAIESHPELKISNGCLPTDSHLEMGYMQNLGFQNYLSLLVIPEDTQPNNQETNQKQLLANNIPPAIVTNNKSLIVIFPFKLKETTPVLLFSEAALDTKPITVMYTDAKVNGHAIKLILDSRLAGSCRVDCTASACIIIADGVTKIPIGEIDNFSFKVNSIIMSIKVLVMKATQILNIATCGHFKTTNSTTPLIEFKEEERKPTWKAYQVSWTEADHNKLPPILSWNEPEKRKQREELIWETEDLTWTNNDNNKLTLNWE
ncbi:hypothetical protein G9A89_017703 [Geosiphon pyriformis]|nr:hypothetical protein G9A89_017703 [Geosiphon pyriformis]